MSVPFLDLRRQVSGLRDELDATIADVLAGGRFLGGEPVERFEEEFATYCGAAHAVGVASGTAAITIALQAAGVEPGDEVLVPANTCVPTVAGVEAAGALPVLVDVETSTCTVDPQRLQAAVAPRTRAVVPVHLYGQCADMEAIRSVARAHGLLLVEDAAQAHGAEYGGRRTGTLGDAAAFSFYPTKNLGALGDGGAVVTNDATIAERARLLRNYGERERYDSVLSGTNSRLDTLQAAVLRVKLRHLERWTARRRRLAALYVAALRETSLVLPEEVPGRRHVYHLFVVQSRARDELRGALTKLGVETLVHYPRPIHRHSAYARLGHGDLAVSERLAHEIVSLPLYAELTDDEAEAVVGAVCDSVGVAA